MIGRQVGDVVASRVTDGTRFYVQVWRYERSTGMWYQRRYRATLGRRSARLQKLVYLASLVDGASTTVNLDLTVGTDVIVHLPLEMPLEREQELAAELMGEAGRPF